MKKWLFCFQKSVALVLTHLRASPSHGEGGHNSIWLSELGHGHGLERTSQITRYSSYDQQQPPQPLIGRAYTAEDINDAKRDKTRITSVSDLTKMNSFNNTNQTNTKDKLLGPTSSIAIANKSSHSSTNFEGSANSPFVDRDSPRNYKLTASPSGLSLDNRSERCSESDDEESSAKVKEDDDFNLMFELETDNRASSSRNSYGTPSNLFPGRLIHSLNSVIHLF